MWRNKIYTFLLTLFTTVLVLISINLFSQKHTHYDKGPGDPCVNMDFQSCDYTGWVLTQGMVDANPYTFLTPTITANWGNGSVIGHPPTVSGPNIADQHFIVNPGVDPNAPIQMTSPYGGGTCTAMLGDGMNDNNHAARMSQTFLVTSTNANFSYNYAAVLEDPSGHTLGQKPYFMARIYDQNGNSIVCAEYEATAGDGSPGWVNQGNLQYKDWSIITVPLQAYIGQNVTVEFTVGDCSRGGHAGYVYIESTCAPMEIIASDTSLCGGPATLTAPSPFNGSYLWHPGGQTTPTITVNTPGLYSVDLISSAGCFVTLDVNISSGNSLVSNFIADTVCLGFPTSFTDISSVATSWNWDFNNDGIVDNTNQNPTYTFLTAGLHPVKLSIIQQGGNCNKDTIINVLVISPPTANFNFNNACVGIPTNFIDGSSLNGNQITSWQWNFDGQGSSSLQNPSFLFGSEGTYPITLAINTSGGCSDSIQLNVIVNPLPQVSFGENTKGCSPVCPKFTNTTSISSGTITSYLWDFGDGYTSTDVTPSHCFQNSSNTAVNQYNIKLTATSNKGCYASFTENQLVTVYPNPYADFSATPEVGDIDNPEIEFTDLSVVASLWNWNFGDGQTSNNANPINVYAESGDYIVQLNIENIYGCKASAEKPVKIKPTSGVWIPNTFTPNGDGVNDYFFIDGYGLTEIDLRIYDRWGVLIMQQIGGNEEVKWDGLYQGHLVQQDVYVYRVRVTDILGDSHKYTGKVTLLK